MNKGHVIGLAHIGVFVADMDKSIEFYKNLGFTLDKEEKPSIRLAFLSAGNCLIELVEKSAASPTNGPVDHIAMTVEDIESAVEVAKAAGADIDKSGISTAPILGGIKNIFFKGPDGESLEYFQYLS